ncbi:MAG: methyltransferase domain-containing protein [Thermodesulfovibrionales bacterium]|nr:methyltransferase domain-containing protein [Thermodesulfovibrionales bacterium]
MKEQEKQSIDFYEAEAETYDTRRWTTRSGRYGDAMQKEIALALGSPCEGMRVLDIATGTGRFALEMARKGAIVTALDSSKAMLEIVEKKFASEGLSDRVKVVHGLATELPLENEAFDLCTCINALNHIPDHAYVLKEIERVLVPGGSAVTNYTNWLSCYMPFGLWVNLRQKSVTRDVYTKWFNPFEIVRLNRSNGLAVKKISGFVHIPAGIDNNIVFGMFKALNFVSRLAPFMWVTPQIFVRSQKERK